MLRVTDLENLAHISDETIEEDITTTEEEIAVMRRHIEERERFVLKLNLLLMQRALYNKLSVKSHRMRPRYDRSIPGRNSIDN